MFFATPEQRGHKWLKTMLEKFFRHYLSIDHENFESVEKFIYEYGSDGPWSDALKFNYFVSTYEDVAKIAKKEWDCMVDEFGPASLTADDQAKLNTMLLMHAYKETSFEPYHNRLPSDTIDHIHQLVKDIQK